jgi:hypothetical protein
MDLHVFTARDEKSIQAANLYCGIWFGIILLNSSLYLGNDEWTSIFFIAARLWETKIQRHSSKSDKKASSQTPEGTLKNKI